jgi:hypothetical protein
MTEVLEKKRLSLAEFNALKQTIPDDVSTVIEDSSDTPLAIGQNLIYSTTGGGGGGGAPTNGTYYTYTDMTSTLPSSRNLTNYTGSLTFVASGTWGITSSHTTLTGRTTITSNNQAITLNPGTATVAINGRLTVSAGTLPVSISSNGTGGSFSLGATQGNGTVTCNNLTLKGNTQVTIEGNAGASLNVTTNSVTFSTGLFYLTGLNANTGTTLVEEAVTGRVVRLSSSARFKEDIQDFTDIQSQRINYLSPKKFKYKDGGARTFGYIAEEVVRFIPEIVNLDKEGLPLSIRYDLLTVFLIEENKRLSHEIQKIKDQLNIKE